MSIQFSLRSSRPNTAPPATHRDLVAQFVARLGRGGVLLHHLLCLLHSTAAAVLLNFLAVRQVPGTELGAQPCAAPPLCRCSSHAQPSTCKQPACIIVQLQPLTCADTASAASQLRSCAASSASSSRSARSAATAASAACRARPGALSALLAASRSSSRAALRCSMSSWSCRTGGSGTSKGCGCQLKSTAARAMHACTILQPACAKPQTHRLQLGSQGGHLRTGGRCLGALALQLAAARQKLSVAYYFVTILATHH